MKMSHINSTEFRPRLFAFHPKTTSKNTQHLTLLCATMALGLVLNGCGQQTPEQHIEAAKSAIQAKKYPNAIIELKSALQNLPSHQEARFLLGQTLQTTEQWQDSEKELKKAMDLGYPPESILPRLAHVMTKQGKFQQVLDLEIPKVGLGSQALAALQAERAEAFLRLGKLSEAEAAIKAGDQALTNIGTDNPSKELLLAKAKLSFAKKNPDEAQSLVAQALAVDEKYIEALYAKAFLLSTVNKQSEATRIYHQIIAIDATQVQSLLALVDIYLKTSRLDDADRAAKAAQKVAPNFGLVYYALANVSLHRGKIKEADDQILQVLKVAPQHIPSLLISAATNYGLGNYEKSRKHAEAVMAAQPDSLSAAKILAASLLKLNTPHLALSTLEPFLQNQTKDPGLYSLLGEAHFQLGDHTKALDLFNRAAALKPDSAYVKTQQAASLIAQGNTPKAIDELELASRLSTAPSQADFALILYKLNKRDFDGALHSIQILQKKSPASPIPHTLRATALLGKNDAVAARTALTQALAVDQSYYPAIAELARLDIQDKHPEVARKRFEDLLDKDRTNAQAMMALADLSVSEPREYVAWLEKAIKASPLAIQPRIRLINHLMSTKDHARAVAIAKDAVSASNEHPGTLALLGNTQVQVDDLSGAISTFTRLTEMAKTSPDAFLRLGLAQARNKQFDAARVSLERAAALGPDFLPAQDALFSFELSHGKPSAALQVARNMQGRKSMAATGFTLEGDTYAFQKLLPQAIKSYSHALSLGAGSEALTRLYRAMLQHGEAAAAEQKLKAWVASHPDDQEIQLLLAGRYEATKRPTEAVAVYEGVLRKFPDNVLALNNLANLYLKAQDPRALATAEKAFQLAPKSHIVQDTLGWILLELGQTPRAIDMLRQSVKQSPQVAITRYHYAVALARTGKRAEARQELQQLLSSGSRMPEMEDARALLKTL